MLLQNNMNFISLMMSILHLLTWTVVKMRKEDTVKLISAEGFEFVIDKKAAMVSQTIRLTSLGSFAETQHEDVTFPEISTIILEKICQYFYWLLQYTRVCIGEGILYGWNYQFSLLPTDSELASAFVDRKRSCWLHIPYKEELGASECCSHWKNRLTIRWTSSSWNYKILKFL
ncbi:uncharacterized protein LOC131318663 [Rhododendron vialii]|uniref:uncharacterized protein LOC131318663 n=1 Tax=Rhododendron vialii TaxID=182163 RepID=UPI00265DAE6F|nr:uncharacterized protein LOC131318663 [Rhododendron vialii]